MICLKKKNKSSFSERIVEFSGNGNYAVECDISDLDLFIKDLDDYGMEYNFSSNIFPWKKLSKGNEVIDGDNKEVKRYHFRIWHVNNAKALKSPAFWNAIVRNKELLDDFTLSTGMANTRLCRAVSRVMDQISLMWGHNGIERDALLNTPIFKDEEIYLRHMFRLVVNGATNPSTPIIVLENAILK